MAVRIKNIDTESHNWGGKLFSPGENYPTENAYDAKNFGFDDTFLSDYKSGKAEIYDADELISSCSKAIYLLQSGRTYTPYDSEYKPYVRVSMTNTEWHYAPRSLDFVTSKVNSLYNRSHHNAGIDDSPDLGDAVLRYYERGEYGIAEEMVQGAEESNEAFQARLSANCVKTSCEFEHPRGIDVWGAKWMFDTAPQSRAYLWAIAAPDVPEEYGGSVPFLGGGMALHMIQPKHAIEFDAKTTKLLLYDGVYHSGKIAFVLKHSPGEQIGIQVVLDFYEE